jgi:hypothetical protein
MPKLASTAAWLKVNVNYYLFRRSPIIVYSMRRTSSVAVHKSLERDGQFTFAAHSFDLGTPQGLSGIGRWGARHIFAKRRPVKIITLVRNPLENMISIFSRKSLGVVLNVPLETIAAGEELTAEKLAHEFLEVHCGQKRHHQEVFWFDNEIKKVLGIDVYQYPFNHEDGFCRINQPPFDLLILRTEVPADRKERLIADFIGSPTFKLISSEEATEGGAEGTVGLPAERSRYGSLYKDLKKCIRMPRAQWEALAESDYMRHFCSPAEIAATAERYAAPE